MLNAGYDVRLASGAITAGGTLGILIPPSVMLIVYAAVAGQSIVKLYAAAMLPGFFLTFLYLVYILGWAIINPKIAPKLLARPVPRRGAGATSGAWSAAGTRSVVPGLLAALRFGRALAQRPVDGGPDLRRRSSRTCSRCWCRSLLTAAPSRATWWYVVVYNAAPAAVASAQPPAAAPAAAQPPRRRPPPAAAGRARRGDSRRSSAPRRPRWRRASRCGLPDAAPEEMSSAAVTVGRDGEQGPRALLPVVLGRWPPSPPSCSSSTSGAWTASSSRSSRS